MQFNKIYNLSLKKIIIILAISFFCGFFVITKAIVLSREGVEQIQKWKMFNFKPIFEQSSTEQTEAIKIVDEQSQVIEVVKKASPAVVSIIASAEVPKFETYYENPSLGIPPEFQQFFNFQFPQRRQNGTEKREVGAGTGFIVSPDGYIITNKHVVSDEGVEYTVYLNNEDNLGEKILAKVLARDPNNDLAVLKIEKNNLPFLSFGDSDRLNVGQTAITIGYALGEFDNTVSKGVVSGLARSIIAGGQFGFDGERLTNVIQTDAAINPGNSGGPMLDLSGNVIGVNVAMANAENIGFALPGNSAREVFEQVKNTGKIKEKEIAFLGVRYLIITEELKDKNSLPVDYGALVGRGETSGDLAVMPGSPADKAGIVENDIILEIDGKKINSKNQLGDIIAKHKPGDNIKLKIFHKGEEKIVDIKLGKK